MDRQILRVDRRVLRMDRRMDRQLLRVDRRVLRAGKPVPRVVKYEKPGKLCKYCEWQDGFCDKNYPVLRPKKLWMCLGYMLMRIRVGR